LLRQFNLENIGVRKEDFKRPSCSLKWVLVFLATVRSSAIVSWLNDALSTRQQSYIIFMNWTASAFKWSCKLALPAQLRHYICQITLQLQGISSFITVTQPNNLMAISC
jgi:hypothetical protein